MYAERENTPNVSPRRDFQSAKIYYNNIVRRNVSLLDEKENRLARLRREEFYIFWSKNRVSSVEW